MGTNQEEVEKILGEPFAMEFSDYVRKIRNGLIMVSVVSIGLLLAGWQISDDSSFLGLRFEGLTQAHLVGMLFALNTYMFVHFLWCSLDYFQEWWLRLSGTRVVYITGAKFASGQADYPDDPRQSTLYNWWKNEAGKISSMREELDDVGKVLINWEKTVRASLEGKDPNVVRACSSISEVSEKLNKLNSSIDNIGNLIGSERIPVSLKRFDRNFHIFLRSQNLRWLVVELAFPLLLGIYALLLHSS